MAPEGLLFRSTRASLAVILLNCASVGADLFGGGVAPAYTACASGRFGPRCDGVCQCAQHEDCYDGLDGDGSCECSIGMEEKCTTSSAASGEKASNPDASSVLRFVAGVSMLNRTLSELRVDKDGRRMARQVWNASVTLVRPRNWKATHLRLALLNPLVVKRLGLNISFALEHEATAAEVFAGRTLIPGSIPFAHAYGGHQFGSWSGQLGDGRAMSLGELMGFAPDDIKFDGSQDWPWEIALKGAGKTPYSRGGDGRATLSNAVREFYAPMYLEAAGVPTVMTLSVIASDDKRDLIVRDEWYDGQVGSKKTAIIMRVAPSFLRFGSLQLAAKRQGVDGLLQIAHFVLAAIHRMESRDDFSTAYLDRIASHVPQWHRERCFFGQRVQPSCAEGHHGTLKDVEVLRCLLDRVVKRTAALVAGWMAIGFAHGVLNTDNLSLLGITIDMNVYGFLSKYDEGFAPNHIDDERRYRFGAQPEIAKWNLKRLADALTGVAFLADREPDARLWMQEDGGRWLHLEEAKTVDARFDERYAACYQARMRLRLGLPVIPTKENKGEAQLVRKWTGWLQKSGADYPRASRGLAEVSLEIGTREQAIKLASHAGVELDTKALETEMLVDFLNTFIAAQNSSRHDNSTCGTNSWRHAIRAAVPLYTLRSHVLREAAKMVQIEQLSETTAGNRNADGRVFLECLGRVMREPYLADEHKLAPATDDVKAAWYGRTLAWNTAEDTDKWLRDRLEALPMTSMQQLTTSCGAQ